MKLMLHDIGPAFALLLVGFLPNEIWRVLAVAMSRGLDENAEILTWVRAVATTLLAGVAAKLLSPGGALAAVPLAARVGSLGVGLAGFYVLRRSVIAGVLLGEAALVALAWWARAGAA